MSPPVSRLSLVLMLLVSGIFALTAIFSDDFNQLILSLVAAYWCWRAYDLSGSA